MSSEEEIKKKFKVFIEQGNIINMEIFEPPKDEDEYVHQAILGKRCISEICSKNPHEEYKIIMDLSALKGRAKTSGQTRRIYEKIMSYPQIKKVAILGEGTFLKTMLNLIIKTSGRSEMLKWFSKKEEALSWLKE